ncbi:MAG: hypothetical protein V1905_04225 [bacterium]
MILRTQEKQEAIRLRKKGYSYSEILDKVHVSKASLSLWLRGIKLNEMYRERLRKRQAKGALKGAMVRHKDRLEITERIKNEAKKEIGDITDRELCLIGAALYWGEGSKQRESCPSTEARFTNSDLSMLKLYLKWLEKTCKIDIDNIKFEIYIHESGNIQKAREFWSKNLNLSIEKFQRVRLKKNKINTKRKNIGDNYHGLLRITVKKSANLNRKIFGWIERICESCEVV